MENSRPDPTAPTLRHSIAPLIRASRNALSFVYPALCILCDEPVFLGGRWLCRACFDKLDANHRNRDACDRCGQNRKLRTCTCHLAWDFSFDRIVSLYDYDETVKAIAHHAKYQGRRRLAYDMGRQSASLVPASLWERIDYITAVPLHWIRWMKRGYNQAEAFARGIAAGANREADFLRNVLVRHRYTKTQVQLDKSLRRENLKGAFRMPPRAVGRIKGKRVLLIDDVITTGATTASCAQVLLQAGCESVTVLSMARD
jgi:ComF family protein